MVVAGAGHGAADHLVVLREAVGQAGDGRDVELGMRLDGHIHDIIMRVEQ